MDCQIPAWLSDTDHPIVIVTDRTGKILHSNRGFQKLVGKKETEVTGSSLLDIIEEPKDLEEILSEGKKAFILRDSLGIEYRCCGFCLRWNEILVFVLEREKMTYNELLREIAETNLMLASTSRDLIRKNQKLREALRKLKELEESDYLTQTLNRRGFIRKLQLELKRANRYKYPLCFVLMDLDDFKTINDTYGHSFGDDVLRKFAKFVRKNIRESDLFGRLGGEEFALLLPHSDCIQGKALCERLIGSFEKYSTKNLGTTVTFSCGLTSFKEGDTFHELYRRADRALYLAKSQGKRRAVIYEDSFYLKKDIKNYSLIDL